MIISISSEEFAACLRQIRDAALEAHAPLVASVRQLIAAVNKGALDAATLTKMGEAIDKNTDAIVAAQEPLPDVNPFPTIDKLFTKGGE